MALKKHGCSSMTRITPKLPEFILWKTGHDINEVVMSSVSKGLKDPIRATVLYDGIIKPSVSYGILRGTGQIFNDCYENDVEYWEVDRGYFKPNHFDGYYRVSFMNMQASYHDISAPNNRFKALRIKVHPWKKQKSNRVLVIPPTDAVCIFYKIDRDKWLEDVMAQLDDFEVKVRAKADSQPLNDDLDYSYCLVTYNSNVAMDALIRGIPAIATSHNSIIKSWNNLELSDIRDYMKLTSFDREKLFNYASYCQWTLSELTRPDTWKALTDIQKGF